MMLEGTAGLDIVKTAISTLSSDVSAVIPLALGVSVLVFGAMYLWRTVRKIVK